MKAIGVDLAWSPRNPTAVAVADLYGGRWTITEVAGGLTLGPVTLNDGGRTWKSPILQGIRQRLLKDSLNSQGAG